MSAMIVHKGKSAERLEYSQPGGGLTPFCACRWLVRVSRVGYAWWDQRLEAATYRPVVAERRTRGTA
jgi:hypothetical protein